jgi:hypothetical protein
MDRLPHDLLPHAPAIGLFRSPDIPEDKLRAARTAFAPTVVRERVVALYDATIFGSARDGILFLNDRLVYQNNPAAPPQTVPYADIEGVEIKPMLLGGRKISVAVSEARTTVMHDLDFSAHRRAAEHVHRFLQAARELQPQADRPVAQRTDIAAVREMLDRLVRDGLLMEVDRSRMLEALGES